MKQIILQTIYKFLRICAKTYIKKHEPIVLWITGSVGKTSGRMIVTQVLQKLSPEKRISTSPKNFNSELGLVFSVFEITEYTPGFSSLLKNIVIIIKKVLFGKNPYDIIFLEYGIDAPGDMKYLTSIIEPDYAMFTRLDLVHWEFFNTKEEIWIEKKILLEVAKKKIYLWENDEYLEKIFSEFNQEKQFFPQVNNVKLSANNSQILSSFVFDEKEISVNLFWIENLVYVALGLQIFKDLWWDLTENTYKFSLQNQPGRFQTFSWIHKSLLIDSSYNAAPASMTQMIENTYKLRDEVYPDRKVMLVLWDMRELWNISKDRHEGLLDFVKHSDSVVTVWPEMKYLCESLKVNRYSGEINTFLKSNEAWKYVKSYLETSKDKYLILFKWSQNTIFTEEALKEVLENKSEASNLVRQSDDWIKKKNKFFKS